MILTRKALSRRSFLGGAGVMVGLPLLDAMLPALTSLQGNAASHTVRLGFVYMPNGLVQRAWLPQQEGAGYMTAAIMKPLQPFQDRCLVLSNLMQKHGRPIGDGGGDHSRASATWLTGVAPRRTACADVEAGISADQVAAEAWTGQTRIRSLELGIERPKQEPDADSGYHSVYRHTVSWRTPTTPNLAETNPRAVFDRLFRSDASGAGPASVLDAVRGSSKRLRSRIGVADRSRLDQHLERVRDLELRIQGNSGDQFEEHAQLMSDLMVAAFQTNATRVASLMLGAEGSNRSYRGIGVSDGHHSVSHHCNDATKLAHAERINTLHVAQFAHLVRTMDATPEGEGTLLDHTMLLFGSSLGDGNCHTHHDLPLVLAGGGVVGISGGRHIRSAPETPMNNLLVAMLQKAGVATEMHGDSTGEIALDGAA